MANPDGIPASAVFNQEDSYFDDPTLTVYIVAADGTITTRPYTDYEAQLANERVNQRKLQDQARAAIAANNTDISNNDAWLAANPGAAVVTRGLVQQSTRQARQLNGLIRLVVGDLSAPVT